MESSPFRLAKGPYLDHERLWLSAGLAKPDVPMLDFSYEQLNRQGRLATQQWGGVPVGDFDSRAIHPATKRIDEQVHRLSLRAEHEIGETLIEDSLTIEFGDTATSRGHAEFSSLPEPGSLPDYLTVIDESNEFKRGSNSLRMTRRLKDWWHFLWGTISPSSTAPAVWTWCHSLPVTRARYRGRGIVRTPFVPSSAPLCQRHLVNETGQVFDD